MREVEVNDWSQFESEVQRLYQRVTEPNVTMDCQVDDPLFRGLGSSAWGLETTLERAFPQERSQENISLLSYYRKIVAAKPVLETLSKKRWPGIPEFPEFERLLEENQGDWLNTFLNRHRSIYRYLIYLRHHGFPSPLLDWTASPYVAALFAFEAPATKAEHIGIYAFLPYRLTSFSAHQHFFTLGPYIQSHPRHFLQQSRYSLCVSVTNDQNQNDFVFLDHLEILNNPNLRSGELIRFKLPITERVAVLKQLDLMNVNLYSLFGSEEALIKTVARRELLFKP